MIMPQPLVVHPRSREALTTQGQSSRTALRLTTLLPEG